MFTQHEQNLSIELQRWKTGKASAASEFSLGNILVADGQITRAQLDEALLNQVSSGLRLGEELIKHGHASKIQVDIGLMMQRKFVRNALAITLGLASITPVMTPWAEAALTSAALPVTASVIANAKIQTQYQVPQLKITQADIARGYVEVPAAMRFSVATNSRSGYLMEFHPVGNLFKSVEIAGLGNPVNLGADGGAIVQRGPLPPTLTHELGFRFTLQADTLPGNYPWPLQLSVRPVS